MACSSAGTGGTGGAVGAAAARPAALPTGRGSLRLCWQVKVCDGEGMDVTATKTNDNTTHANTHALGSGTRGANHRQNILAAQIAEHFGHPQPKLVRGEEAADKDARKPSNERLLPRG